VPRRERRGVAVVDRHDAPVRDDVAGDATCDAHGVEALAELQLVDGAGGGRVLGESPQDLGGVVDRVVPLPRSRAVGGPTARRHPGPEGSVAAALDRATRGLEENGEVGIIDELRSLLLEMEQTVELALDLLALVED